MQRASSAVWDVVVASTPVGLCKCCKFRLSYTVEVINIRVHTPAYMVNQNK